MAKKNIMANEGQIQRSLCNPSVGQVRLMLYLILITGILNFVQFLDLP